MKRKVFLIILVFLINILWVNAIGVTNKLSEKYKINILKGASDKVDDVGREIVKKYGKEELYKIAKINFKNTEKILNN